MKLKQKILRLICSEPGIRTKDICQVLDITSAEVWDTCDELLDEGLIIRQILPLPLRWYPTNKDLLL